MAGCHGQLGGHAVAVGGMHGHVAASYDGGDDDEQFHHRKVPADTDARAAAERDVGAGRAGMIGVGGIEAGGVESVGIFPEIRMALEGVAAEDDHGASRDDLAAQLGVVDGVAVFEPEGRMEAQGFLNGHIGVFQGTEMILGQWPFAENGANLIEDAALHLGMVVELEPEPGERGRGGFVAADDHTEDFLADLVLVHLRAVLVAGGEQHAQQIVLRSPADARADQATHEIPEVRHYPADAQIGGRWETEIGNKRQRRLGAVAVDSLGPFPDPRDRAVEAIAEKRAPRDLKSEMVHFLRDVKGLVSGQHGGVRAIAHQRKIGTDGRGREHRLHELALPLPGLAFRSDQAVAEDVAEVVVDAAVLVEIAVRFPHHLPDERRVVDEVEADETAIADEVAVVANQAIEEMRRVSRKHPQPVEGWRRGEGAGEFRCVLFRVQRPEASKPELACLVKERSLVRALSGAP